MLPVCSRDRSADLRPSRLQRKAWPLLRAQAAQRPAPPYNERRRRAVHIPLSHAGYPQTGPSCFGQLSQRQAFLQPFSSPLSQERAPEHPEPVRGRARPRKQRFWFPSRLPRALFAPRTGGPMPGGVPRDDVRRPVTPARNRQWECRLFARLRERPYGQKGSRRP